MEALVEQHISEHKKPLHEKAREQAVASYSSQIGAWGIIAPATLQQGLTGTPERELGAGAAEFRPRPLIYLGDRCPSMFYSGVQISLGEERGIYITQVPGEAPLSTSVFGQPDLEVRRNLVLNEIKTLLEEGAVDRAWNLWCGQSAAIKADKRLSRLVPILKPGRVEARDVRGPHRRAELAWIQSNATQYKGKWVAVLGDTLIASGEDLKSVIKLVNEKGLRTRPLIHRMV